MADEKKKQDEKKRADEKKQQDEQEAKRRQGLAVEPERHDAGAESHIKVPPSAVGGAQGVTRPGSTDQGIMQRPAEGRAPLPQGEGQQPLISAGPGGPSRQAADIRPMPPVVLPGDPPAEGKKTPEQRSQERLQTVRQAVAGSERQSQSREFGLGPRPDGGQGGIILDKAQKPKELSDKDIELRLAIQEYDQANERFGAARRALMAASSEKFRGEADLEEILDELKEAKEEQEKAEKNILSGSPKSSRKGKEKEEAEQALKDDHAKASQRQADRQQPASYYQQQAIEAEKRSYQRLADVRAERRVNRLIGQGIVLPEGPVPPANPKEEVVSGGRRG